MHLVPAMLACGHILSAPDPNCGTPFPSVATIHSHPQLMYEDRGPACGASLASSSYPSADVDPIDCDHWDLVPICSNSSCWVVMPQLVENL